MPDLFRLKTWITAAVLSAAVVLGAAEKDLFSMLPADSAIVMEVNTDALCEDPQGALVLSILREISDTPWEELSKVAFSCDAGARKWSFAFRVKESSDLDKICADLQNVPEKERIMPDIPAYLFPVASSKKRITHLYRVNKTDAMILYPADLHRRAVKKDDMRNRDTLDKLLPDHTNAFILSAGIIKSRKFILKNLHCFTLALEKDFFGDLRLHGKFVATSAAHASAAHGFINLSLPLALAIKFGIPISDGKTALESLNITRKENILYFSTTDFEPFLKVLGAMLKDKIPSPAEVTE